MGCPKSASFFMSMGITHPIPSNPIHLIYDIGLSAQNLGKDRILTVFGTCSASLVCCRKPSERSRKDLKIWRYRDQTPNNSKLEESLGKCYSVALNLDRLHHHHSS